MTQRPERGRAPARIDARGQSLVEFTLIVPFITTLLLGIVEFGFIFSNYLTLEYGTREGARMGAALASGTASVACADVDSYVISAVERVIESSGSQVNASKVSTITIFRSDANGAPIAGTINVWTYSKNGGPSVDGQKLDWTNTSTAWSACTRNNGPVTYDSIGVALQYDYSFVTPVGNWLGPLRMNDRTVMSLNPKTPGT